MTTSRRESYFMTSSQTKKKITISLSKRSLAAIERLREVTDADTDSEVLRNAMRLHLALVRAQRAGADIFMRNDNTTALVPATLFVREGDS
jgi:hypothetical protein